MSTVFIIYMIILQFINNKLTGQILNYYNYDLEWGRGDNNISTYYIYDDYNVIDFNHNQKLLLQ